MKLYARQALLPLAIALQAVIAYDQVNDMFPDDFHESDLEVCPFRSGIRARKGKEDQAKVEEQVDRELMVPDGLFHPMMDQMPEMTQPTIKSEVHVLSPATFMTCTPKLPSNDCKCGRSFAFLISYNGGNLQCAFGWTSEDISSIDVTMSNSDKLTVNLVSDSYANGYSDSMSSSITKQGLWRVAFYQVQLYSNGVIVESVTPCTVVLNGKISPASKGNRKPIRAGKKSIKASGHINVGTGTKASGVGVNSEPITEVNPNGGTVQFIGTNNGEVGSVVIQGTDNNEGVTTAVKNTNWSWRKLIGQELHSKTSSITTISTLEWYKEYCTTNQAAPTLMPMHRNPPLQQVPEMPTYLPVPKEQPQSVQAPVQFAPPIPVSAPQVGQIPIEVVSPKPTTAPQAGQIPIGVVPPKPTTAPQAVPEPVPIANECLCIVGFRCDETGACIADVPTSETPQNISTQPQPVPMLDMLPKPSPTVSLVSSSCPLCCVNGMNPDPSTIPNDCSSCPMTCPDFYVSQIQSEIKTLIQSDPSLAPKFLRMAFHDCVGGCDGCIDLTNEFSNGLFKPIQALDSIVSKYVNLSIAGVSRADIWMMAAIVAANVSQDSSNPVEFTFDWIGRVDCEVSNTACFDSQNQEVPCAATRGPHRDLPHASLLTNNLLHFFNMEFGFSAAQVVALMGVHTLGSAHREFSGYSGAWVPGSKLTNNYYQNIVGGSSGVADSLQTKIMSTDWQQVLINNTDIAGMPNRWQWEQNGRMMLDVDMALVRDYSDFFNAATGEALCSHLPPDSSSTGSKAGCPFASQTIDIVAKYKNDGHLWLMDFKEVLSAMVIHGYTSNGTCDGSRVCSLHTR